MRKVSDQAIRKMIKVSHEVPLSLLEESRSFNDFDYALVHLFEEQPQYLQFYIDSVEMGRDVLLDNSIFELGDAFDDVTFAYWIDKLRPTRFVIPDVMHDCDGTLRNLYKWIIKYDNLPGKTIGVVQGTTYEELTKCYLEIANLCDEISINVAKKYYPIKDQSKSLEWNYMVGRQDLIQRWIDDGVINYSKPHHLLGCRLPQEFSYYKNMDFITSLDTSNPIVHGIEGIAYDEFGLQKKSSTLLANLIDIELSQRQRLDVYYNIQQFKNMMSR